MFWNRVLPFVATLGCIVGTLESTAVEAAHGRRQSRNRCCEPVAERVPECCDGACRATDEWMEWHPDRDGGHHHRYRSVVRDDCRREVVEVPMYRRKCCGTAAVANDRACCR